MNQHVMRPVPALAELREAVLLRSEKRKPKWGFRIANDLVMEIQPQPVSLVSPFALSKGVKQLTLSFNGHAVEAEGATEGMLKKLPHAQLFCARKFSLFQWAEDDPEHWRLTLFGGSANRGSSRDIWNRLDRRILGEFETGFFDRLTPESMLRPACLYCGKALTDPASMARWIGPECAGTSTIRTFWAKPESLPLLDAAE